MLLNARRIPRAPAKPQIILLAIEDITEHKKNEELEKYSERKFRAIFDNAADGILLAEVGSKKFYLGNQAICKMLGYSQEEIKNLGVDDIHPKKDLPYVLDQFKRQAKGEFTLSKDMPILRKNGTVFYADVNATIIKPDGKTFLMGFFHDTTERKKAEHAIELEKQNIFMIGREIKMAELKEEIKELKKQLE